MPLKITGKILDESGLPLYQIAQISEVPASSGQVVGGNVWSDENTGAFTFMALDPVSTIKVEAHGYTPVSFKASAFPSIVKLQPILVIEGTVTEKKTKDNTLTWLLVGIAAAVVVGVATNNSSTDKATPVKRIKKQVKPITVKV